MLPIYLHVNDSKNFSWHARNPETNIVCQLDCLEFNFKKKTIHQYVDLGYDCNIILNECVLYESRPRND